MESLTSTAPLDVAIGASESARPFTKLYWTEFNTGSVEKANLDGSAPEDIQTSPGGQIGVAVDSTRGKIFWGDQALQKIRRSNLDGTNVEDIIDTSHSILGLSVDPISAKLYWVDQLLQNVQRANLDGTDIEEVVTGLSFAGDVAVDPLGSKVYWTDFGTSKVQRADLDGTNVEDLATGLNAPFGIALDTDDGKVYWTEDLLGEIHRADLNGSAPEVVVTGLSRVPSVVLDPGAGKMYWADDGAGKIQRADLDGLNTEDLVSGHATYIALGFEPIASSYTPEPFPRIYWSERNSIRRSGRDGSNVVDLVIGLDNPNGVAVDVTGGKVYWTDDGSNKIQRANLDGSSVEDLVTTGLERPFQIALDYSGKMYWTDRGTGKVQRAAVDGTSVEDLATGLADALAVGIDVAARRLYWTDAGNLYRAALNGTGAQLLATIEGRPHSIEIDANDGRMYWVNDAGIHKIQRADLDGANVEDVATGVRGLGLGIDPSGAKVYWTAYLGSRMRRANLDGTDQEEIGGDRPEELALEIPVLGTAGGTIMSDTGHLTITIPPGALSGPTPITLTENTVGQFLPGEFTPGQFVVRHCCSAIGVAVSARPRGLHFDRPVTWTFRWDDRDDDGIVDSGLCLAGNDEGESCDSSADCEGVCSVESSPEESDLVLKRNTVRYSKNGFNDPSMQYRCSDHLSGACATATAECSDAAGTGKSTVARCCDPTNNTWTVQTCNFSELFLGEHSGDLIPGRRTVKFDCNSEWSVENPLNKPAHDIRGWPHTRQTCRDGDPVCDQDESADGQCTMALRVCLNVEDLRLQRKGNVMCTPDEINRWTMLTPRPDDNDPIRSVNATALRDAVLALGSGAVEGNHQEEIVFSPTVTGEVCTDSVLLHVPLRGPGLNRHGRLVLRAQADQPPPPGERRPIQDRDRLILVCQPSR